jgi:hypothetical protein
MLAQCVCWNSPLKSFLVHGGRTERDLRALGHDLHRLLQEAESLGLTSTGSRHFRLAVLGANYEDRIFACPEDCTLNVILPCSLREVANGLVREVFLLVKGEEVFAQLQSEPGLCIGSSYPDDLDPSAWTVAAKLS